MTGRLQNKVIVITGASSGIGEQVAMQVAAQGADSSINGSNRRETTSVSRQN